MNFTQIMSYVSLIFLIYNIKEQSSFAFNSTNYSTQRAMRPAFYLILLSLCMLFVEKHLARITITFNWLFGVRNITVPKTGYLYL